MLKPGGVTMHHAPFSFFYHSAPGDFWRYTPEAFGVLFSDLEPLVATFNRDHRRRDNRGKPHRPLDTYGGSDFSVDAFGGWRETWHTTWAGRKSAAYLAEKIDVARHQLVVDLVKGLGIRGIKRAEAFCLASATLVNFDVDRDGIVRRVPDGTGIVLNVEELRDLWKSRQQKGIHPTRAHFKVPIILGLVQR